MKPPKEADESPNNVWKLNATIYGFTDASHSWYISLRINHSLQEFLSANWILQYLFGIMKVISKV